MGTKNMLTMGIVLLLLFAFIRCSDNPLQMTQQKDGLTLQKKGSGGGSGGGQGGPPGEPDKMRGGDFGDLYILWRTADGAPICTLVPGEKDEEVPKVQPIAFEGSWIDGVAVPVTAAPEYFPVEWFDYDYYWDGYYNIGDSDWDDTYQVVTGVADAGTVVPYTELGDLDQTLEYVPAGVEIGRKNLARSPQSGLDRALDEAIKTLALDAPGGSPITIDYCGRLVGKIVDQAGEIVDKTIDSPRENMALYQYIMMNQGFGGAKFAEVQGKFSDLLDRFGPTQGLTWLDVAASCFAAAADKTDNLCVDEIVYCNTFLGINGEEDNRNYAHYTEYIYNRETNNRYDQRWIKVITLNTDGYTIEKMSIAAAAAEGRFDFTEKYNGSTNLAAFRTAADDAMQVLEYIHGDSNMEWLGHGTDPGDPEDPDDHGNLEL